MILRDRYHTLPPQLQDVMNTGNVLAPPRFNSGVLRAVELCECCLRLRITVDNKEDQLNRVPKIAGSTFWWVCRQVTSSKKGVEC